MLGGCSLIPDYQQPAGAGARPVPARPGVLAGPGGEQAAAEQGWRQFFHDPALQQLIQMSLENNRDLRVAALNIDAYRAQYRIQRADLFPAGGSLWQRHASASAGRPVANRRVPHHQSVLAPRSGHQLL